MVKHNLKDLTKKIYYDIGNAGSFSGPVKIQQILLKKYNIKVGLETIRKILQTEDSYSLQRTARRNFRRAKIIVSGMYEQFDCDLADFSNISRFNQGYKFILFVLDSFSRFLWLIPLKNKTGNTVLNAFKSLFLKVRKPNKIYSDFGSEFKYYKLEKYLKSLGIYHHFALNELHASKVERCIRTIKHMLYRYFNKARTYKYIDVLPKFVETYNKTPHRSLNYFTPADVNSENESDLFSFMYVKNEKRRIKKFELKVNDLVRISNVKIPFKKSYDQQWTSEIFKVYYRLRIQGINMYKLKDYHGEKIRGLFYFSELQYVNKDKDALFFIEKILKTRRRKGKKEYYVKFIGWNNSYNQWIPDKDIIDTETTVEVA